MQALTQKKTVVAVFVTEARMERDCIRLYARTHPEVRAAAVVLSGGQELLQHLRCGLTPQVLVLDVLLTDMGDSYPDGGNPRSASGSRTHHIAHGPGAGTDGGTPGHADLWRLPDSFETLPAQGAV